MPWGFKRYQQTRQLHFVTFTCYHRKPLLDDPQTRDLFVLTLETVREWYGYWLVGYVVMPEHVHLLLSEPERKNLGWFCKSQIVILSEAGTSRSEVSAESKDPYSRRLVVEQLPSLPDRGRGRGRDRIALDSEPPRETGPLSYGAAPRPGQRATPSLLAIGRATCE